MVNFSLETVKKNAKILLEGMWYTELPQLLDKERLYNNLIDVLKNVNDENIYNSYQMDEQHFITDYKNIDTPSYLRKPGVEPITYYSFKNNKSLREMQIPNLIHYISFVYNSLWAFDDLFEEIYCNPRNKVFIENSNSYVVFNELFCIQNQYEDDEEVELGIFTNKNNKIQENAIISSNKVRYDYIAEGYLYGIKMDIESFFPNIYTHYLDKISTMEPFSGLESVKKYFKFLDTFHQRINNNQTKGIPAGTFSAHIAAELCMLCVDARIKKIIDTNKTGYIRYVDDLTFFADSKDELAKMELDIQKVLNIFRLRINGNKTNIFKNALSKQSTNIYEINNKLSFLYYDEEKYVLTTTDIQNLKEYIAELFEVEKISQIKTILTIILNHICLDYIDIQDVYLPLFCYFLTLTFENENLAVHCYRILDEMMEKDSNNKCYSILEKKTDMVDKKYSETLLQIWHYYVLVKYMSKIEKKKFFENHAYKLKNPIIYTFFVEEGKKTNSHIVRKIKESFLSEETNSGWKKKIIYSKWWLPLAKIRMVDCHNYEKIFDEKIFPKVLDDILQ